MLLSGVVVSEQMKQYRNYERIMKMELWQPVVETLEFKQFSQVYPNIAQSIVLKRKIQHLTNELKSDDFKGSKFKLKREISKAKSKLKKNKLTKGLHGENKQESVFQKKYKRKIRKARSKAFRKKVKNRISRPFTKFRKRLSSFMHRNLPPSVFNLNSMDISERGFELREWLKQKRKKL